MLLSSYQKLPTFSIVL